MSILREIHDRLGEFYAGERPMEWWPGDPLEVIVGAILVPGSNWKIVSKILDAIRRDNLLTFHGLRGLDPERLTRLIRPAGFQQRKGDAIRAVLEMIDAESGGDLPRFFARNVETVRGELLAIKGIGTSVADNILLYAGKLPVYMVDPFTVRVLTRHGIVPHGTKEAEIQRVVHQELTHDDETAPYGADLYYSFQALIVRLGRTYCEKTEPACWSCPLRSLLPDGKPVLASETRQSNTTGRRATETGRRDTPGFFGEPQNYDRANYGRANYDRADSHRRATGCSSRSSSRPPGVSGEIALDDNERTIMERITAERVPIDIVVAETGLPVHIVQSTLIGLEFKRLVRRCEGNTVQRRT